MTTISDAESKSYSDQASDNEDPRPSTCTSPCDCSDLYTAFRLWRGYAPPAGSIKRMEWEVATVQMWESWYAGAQHIRKVRTSVLRGGGFRRTIQHFVVHSHHPTTGGNAMNQEQVTMIAMIRSAEDAKILLDKVLDTLSDRSISQSTISISVFPPNFELRHTPETTVCQGFRH